MEHETAFTTTIDPSVLYTITRLTTLATPGVSKLAPVSFGANKLAQENLGIKMDIEDHKIFIDIYIETEGEENVRIIAETVQTRVTRAITDMVGMEVANINVHITDIVLKVA